MKKIILSILIHFVFYTNAYFYVPNFMSKLPFQDGMAFAQKKNALVLFGGENATNTYTNNFYQLTQLNSTFTWEAINQTNTPPGTLYGQAVVANNDETMFLFGGVTNSTKNQFFPLQYYQYSFANQSWTASSTNSRVTTANFTDMPLNRKLFTATYDGQNKIYIYGGALNETVIFADFWSFDISTNKFERLPSVDLPRYGHTASYIADGKIAFIGGVVQINDNGQFKSALAPITQVHLFDTKTNQWEVKTVTGENSSLPSTRTSHSAIVSSNGDIIVFGGDNGAPQRKRVYLNSLAILDTKRWTWSLPKINGILPPKRSYAVAAILSENYLTIAFGSSNNIYYNDINVLDIKTNSWIQSFKSSSSNSDTGLSSGIIAGVAIGCVVVTLIIVFLLWRFQSYVRWLLSQIHNDIWKPRAGEPVWAEITRIVFEVLLLFIFSVFIAFVIRQAVNSPVVVQTIQESVAEVQVPDIRFCFDGYPSYPATDNKAPGVSCQTNNGVSCTKFVQPLDMSIFQPTFSDNLGPVSCFLFRTPTDFTMTSTSGANNGSQILFNMFGDPSAYGVVHVSVFPKQMDPNTLVYGIHDELPSLMSESAVLNWQNAERNDIHTTNVFTVKPFTYSSLSYRLIDHQYLQDVGWNYVGFLPITNSTPIITSSFSQNSANPSYAATHMDLGVFAVYPEAFVLTREREVKLHSILNAFGLVGGVLGLLVAVQTWLFGYRPRSPWGVVHRWSVGDMKRSLLNGLQAKFKMTDSGIPLVHPVNHRFSLSNQADHEPEKMRINRVEERMQMLEMLFKAYYVNDEVFRSLDSANRKDSDKMMDSQFYNSTAHTGSDSGRFAPVVDHVMLKSEKIGDEDSQTSETSYDLHKFKHN